MELFWTSGSGNDFLALVEPERPPDHEVIRAWCRRGVSLGADGFFVLDRRQGGVRMGYWNADGRPADLCLNGTRCAAQLAFYLGWAIGEVTVETAAGSLVARRLDRARVALAVPPAAGPAEALAVEREGRRHEGFRTRVGVPHYVLPWNGSLRDAPVAVLGAALRRHPAFGSSGTNVDFVRFPAPDRLEIRSFERGVEAETLACGTGILAAVLAGLATGAARLPLTALTAGGFLLEVSGTAGPVPASWTLAGDARVLARGEVLDEAAVEPAPPAWS